MPFERRDGRCVPREPRYRVVCLEVAQVPYLEGAVVGPRRHEIRHGRVPRYDVDVGVGGLHMERAGGVDACVPDAERSIHRATREHIGLVGAPLQILDRVGVSCVRCADRPCPALHSVPDIDGSRAITRQQPPRGHLGPIHGIALRRSCVGEHRSAWAFPNCRCPSADVQGLQLGGDVHDVDVACLRPCCNDGRILREAP
mmetsp:Transcript_30594/g.71861  ORF Transcript_30594/g.71861 Transcript_30594/m.71861 type:complete len:200 (+) Transcript_30594:283-882(+)